MRRNILDFCDQTLISISALLFAIILLVNIAEILIRGILGFSLLWVVDLSVLLASWTMLMGAASCVYRNEHFVMDFIERLFPPAGRQILRLILRLFFLAVTLNLTYNGIIIAKLKMGMYYTILRWPTGFAYIALPVFGFFASIFLIDKILVTICDLKNHVITEEAESQLEEVL